MSQCEACARETDYLFAGVITSEATRYSPGPNPKPLGVVDVERDGRVCFRCRPLSNLEIEETHATKRTNTRPASSRKNSRPLTTNRTRAS